MAPSTASVLSVSDDGDESIGNEKVDSDEVKQVAKPKPQVIYESRHRERWFVVYKMILYLGTSYKHTMLTTCSTNAAAHRYQLWLPQDPPRNPWPSLDEAPTIPIATASFWSLLTFSWITEIMVVGWQRSLQVLTPIYISSPCSTRQDH